MITILIILVEQETIVLLQCLEEEQLDTEKKDIKKLGEPSRALK
jgi:hypothetical protein